RPGRGAGASAKLVGPRATAPRRAALAGPEARPGWARELARVGRCRVRGGRTPARAAARRGEASCARERLARAWPRLLFALGARPARVHGVPRDGVAQIGRASC